MNDQTQHARLSCSAGDRWVSCPGSVNMIAFYPPQVTNAAMLEGSTAHWGGYLTLNRGHWSSAEVVGDVCPETGLPFTTEMVEAVDVYVNYVKERYQALREGTGKPVQMLLEHRVNPGLELGRPDCWGRLDCGLIADTIIESVDYKHGAGVLVNPDTAQNKLYLLGLKAKEGARPWYRSTIVQPRAIDADTPIRSLDILGADLEEFRLKAERSAHQTDLPDAPLIPTEKGCRWCQAKGACVAYAEDALRKAQVLFVKQPLADIPASALEQEVKASTADVKDRIRVLTPEQKLVVLDNRAMIKALLDAVEADCLQSLIDGTADPVIAARYKVVEGRSNRRWDPELKEEDIIKKLKGMGLRKPDYIEEKLRSAPRMADDVIKPLHLTERRQKTFDAMVVTPPGKLTLAPRADTRVSAVKTPQEMFKPMEQMDLGIPSPEAVTQPETQTKTH